MFLRFFLIFSLLSVQVFASHSFLVKCVTANQKKNSVELKIKAEFELGKEEHMLSDIVADVDVKMRVKAQFNDKEFADESFTVAGHYRKVTDDEVAFDEKITGHNKKVKFEYLFIDDKKGSLNIDIDGVTHGHEHLECVLD